MVLYFLGRKNGRKVISKFPHIEIYYPKAKKLFDKYGMWAIFITRYLYGLRFASATFYGLMKMRARDFLCLAFLSCLVWSIVIGSLGYLFGASLEGLIRQVKQYEKIIVVAIVILGITIWLIRRLIYKTKKTTKDEDFVAYDR